MSDVSSVAELNGIFRASLIQVDPLELIQRSLAIDGGLLRIATPTQSHVLPLVDFERIFVTGTGKATARMALALEEILGDRLTEGVISVKYGHTEVLRRIRIMEAGHPIPDENGLIAAKEVLSLVSRADQKTLVISLISGGGSALLVHPLEEGPVRLRLEDKQRTTELLLQCGANINEINCIRKHISQIKGGRLCRWIHPAPSLNLFLSDVVGDRLDVIASGLTVPDTTTYKQGMGILEKYDLLENVPAEVRRVFELGVEGSIPETPKEGDPIFEGVQNILLGTNYTALLAAKEESERRGLQTIVLSSQITGEAREVARVFAGIAKDIKLRRIPLAPPACVIAGGETTVTIRGRGTGGRNQELALAFLAEMAQEPNSLEGVHFLSASTDGNDGPTDAAGAFVNSDVLLKASRLGLDPQRFLADNDSYHFFEKVGALLKTGPTNTNVCDIQILIVR
jgi:hydroxypyruvate reductase